MKCSCDNCTNPDCECVGSSCNCETCFCDCHRTDEEYFNT